VALGYGFLRLLSSLSLRASIPLELDSHLDLRELGWTLAIAMVAGVGFGLMPAVSSTRTDIGSALKEGAQAPLRGYGRFGMRNLFIVFQMAASLMLVLVTGLVAAAFLSATRVNPGFEMAGLSLVSVDPMRDGYSAPEAARLLEALPYELSRIGGIRAVTLSDAPPLAWFAATPPTIRLTVPAGQGRNEELIQTVFTARIGAKYFAVLEAPLASGLEFDQRKLEDRAEHGLAVAAIINQTAARLLFGTENPIGRRIREGGTSYTVVGVARDSQPRFLRSKPEAMMFLPFTAAAFLKNPAQVTTVLLRGVPGEDVVGAVRSQLASLHPSLTVFNARTVEEDLRNWSAFVEWQSAIFVILAGLAWVLASIGLGGVTAYAVARRGKEIGIRMALGASGRQIQRLVLREGAELVAVGSILGFGGALFLCRVLTAYSDMLARTFDRPVSRPLLMIVPPLVLASLTMLACYLPARRATRIEPVVALRQE
jgi:predicted permease